MWEEIEDLERFAKRSASGHFDKSPEYLASEKQNIRNRYNIIRKDLPLPTLSDVVDHIDRVVNLVGIDHVGIGSDYDGVGDTLPSNLKDVSTFPNLISELLTRGYTEEDIEKILSGNIIRVWKEVEDFANGRKPV